MTYHKYPVRKIKHATYPPIQLDGGYVVETWYNRHARAWVTALKDKDGNQIGDAMYDGNRVAVPHTRDWCCKAAKEGGAA